MIKAKRLSLMLVVFFGVSGCTGIPDGVEAVEGFELERYLGTWYEIARLDHRFERGLSEVTAIYSANEDGSVRVLNRGFDEESAEWEEATGKALMIDRADQGRLKVSFFGPFYGAYNIFELDAEGYRYAMVSGPDRSYLWILSRTPILEAPVLERLLEKARTLGYPVDDLIFVAHGVQGRGT